VKANRSLKLGSSMIQIFGLSLSLDLANGSNDACLNMF
jgi:hypothetical protein